MKIKRLIGIFLGAAIMTGVGWWTVWRPAPMPLPFEADTTSARDQAFSYDDYAAALKTYVDDQGMVNYRGLEWHEWEVQRAQPS